MSNMKKAFTLIEAIIGTVLLGVVVGGASEYYIGKVQSAKDADTAAIVQSITATTGKSLAAAYTTEIRENLNQLVAEKNSRNIRQNMVTISNSAKNSVMEVIQEHFKDPVFYTTGEGDPLNRASYGADSINEQSPVVKLKDKSIGVKVVFHQIVNGDNDTPPPVRENDANNLLTVRYKNDKSDLDIRLYNTLLVTYNTKYADTVVTSMDELADAVVEDRLKPTDVSFAMITEGEVDNIENPIVATSVITSPFSAEFMEKIAATGTETPAVVNTPQYDNETESGSYEVKTVDIKLWSASESKIYDGTPLLNQELNMSGALGQFAYLTNVSVTGSITDAGTVVNDFSYQLINNDKYTVYNITVDKGELVIGKRPITVASHDCNVSDVKKEASLVAGSLAPGESITYIFPFNNTSDSNVFTAVITGGGRNTTHNYDITYKYGHLTGGDIQNGGSGPELQVFAGTDGYSFWGDNGKCSAYGIGYCYLVTIKNPSLAHKTHDLKPVDLSWLHCSITDDNTTITFGNTGYARCFVWSDNTVDYLIYPNISSIENPYGFVVSTATDAYMLSLQCPHGSTYENEYGPTNTRNWVSITDCGYTGSGSLPIPGVNAIPNFSAELSDSFEAHLLNMGE